MNLSLKSLFTIFNKKGTPTRKLQTGVITNVILSTRTVKEITVTTPAELAEPESLPLPFRPFINQRIVN